jgi:hypothetical protein
MASLFSKWTQTSLRLIKVALVLTMQIIESSHSSCASFFQQNSTLEKHLLSFHTEGVGYTTFGGDEQKEGFVVHLPAPGTSMFYILTQGFPFPWPDQPADFEDNITKYFKAFQSRMCFLSLLSSSTVGESLLRAISVHLGEEATSLTQFLDGEANLNPTTGEVQTLPPMNYSSSVLFIRNYPTQENKGEEPREQAPRQDDTHPHTDRFSTPESSHLLVAY